MSLILEKRRYWYSFSIVFLAAGITALLLWGLQLGIDFTGGTVVEVGQGASLDLIESIAAESGLSHISTTSSDQSLLVRFSADEPAAAREQFFEKLQADEIPVLRLDTVGPSVSRDIVKNAALSITVLSGAIILYIAYAFRGMPPPVSSVAFGVIAVLALIHDALLVLGSFAILGRFAGVEVDSFFVTAILTVIGFSVHDTIVVFDRVRERLNLGETPFAKVVSRSISEVMVRSLNTSLVIIIVLFALLLFGGASIRYFVLALLIGMISGTYSSLFIASPLLISWNAFRARKKRS